MSRQTPGTVVTAEAKLALVPKLRFPEFRSAPAWRLGTLSQLAARAKQKNRDERITRVLTNSAEFGVMDQRDFFDKDIATQGKLESYFVVELGSYVYNPRISTTAPVGPISKNKIGTGVMSPLYTVFKFKNDSNDFYEHYFKTAGWHTYMRQASSTGARHDRMAISGEDFMAMPMPVSTPEEQQKIADCLGSLDELIAARGRKVAALKTHKKGLMQQLFPREGETQPRLRFPEFQETADWATGPFGEVFDTTSGGTPSRSNSEYWNGDVSWVTTTQVNFGVITAAEEFISQSGLKNSSAKVFPKGTVLIAMYGQGKTRGQVAMLGIDAATNQACAAVLPLKKVDPRFVLFNLSARYEELRRLSNSGGQENLSQGLIRELPFSYPEEVAEQQRIADCLSSVDALIAVATQTLDTLKTHKQGLMQQLFPSSEAREA
jgi:type I restriction enzyme S subunit